MKRLVIAAAIVLSVAVLVGLAGSQREVQQEPQFITVSVLDVGRVNRYSLNRNHIASFVQTGNPTITTIWMTDGEWFQVRADYDVLLATLGAVDIPPLTP